MGLGIYEREPLGEVVESYAVRRGRCGGTGGGDGVGGGELQPSAGDGQGDGDAVIATGMLEGVFNER